MFAALAILCASLSSQDEIPLKERLKDPKETWKLFKQHVRAGEYGKAQELLSPAARKAIPTEALTLTFSAYDASRRLVDRIEAHAASTGLGTGADPVAGTLRLCSPEFGISREFKTEKFHGIQVLDLTMDDIEFLRGRTMAWYRHQVKRADGWHCAYPPDWTYAPLARTCLCGK